MSRSRIVRSAREVLLTAGALLGVLCIVMTAAGFAFGLKPLVFRSGSMSPAIHTGDLAFSRTVDASELNRGDIVSVLNSEGNRVTHRLVNSAAQGDARQLKLKGDANESSDAEIYTVSEAQHVMFDVPKAGYVVSAASSPGGVFVLGLYVALMLVLVFRKQSPSEGGDGSAGGGAPRNPAGGRRTERPSRHGRARSAAVLAIAASTATATISASGSTSAAPWTDPVVIAGGTFTAYTVPKPAITSCTITGGLGQKTATIVWTEVSSPFALDYTATIVETGLTMTVTDNGSTRQTQFSAGLLSTVFNATYNIRITAKLPAPNGGWVSVNANQPVTIGLLGVSMSCGTAT